MTRARVTLETAIWRHGWIWLASVACLCAALLLQWALVRPGRLELAQLRQSVADAPERSDARAGRVARQARLVDERLRLSELRDVLQGADMTDRAIGVILDSATRLAIEVPRGDYQANLDATIGIVRTQVTFSVKANYPLLRAFIEDVLRRLPNASVDQLSFKRDAVAQSQVEATLKLSLWSGTLSQTPAPSKPPVAGRPRGES